MPGVTTLYLHLGMENSYACQAPLQMIKPSKIWGLFYGW